MQPSAISLTWNNALNSSFVVLFLSKGPDTTTVIQIFFPSRAGLVTVLNLKHFLWYRKQRDFREQPSAIKGRKKIVQWQFSNVLMQCSDVLNFTKIVILLINIYIVHMFTIYFKDILSSVNFLSVSTMIFYYKLITLGKSRADNECNYFDLLAKQLRSNALQTLALQCLCKKYGKRLIFTYILLKSLGNSKLRTRNLHFINLSFMTTC